MKINWSSLLAGPLLVMDLGTHSIKLVEGRAKGDSILLERAFTIPTPENSVLDGRILNLEGLIQSIFQLLKQEKIKTGRVAFTIESSAIISREIILPAVKQDELNAMLEFEIQNYFPIELEQYMIQKKVLTYLEEAGVKKVKLQVVALQREISQEYLALAQALKLKPAALDLHANCISKLLAGNTKVNGQYDLSQETVAVLDFGYQNSNVIIIEKGIYQFSRTIPLGGAEIDIQVANAFNLSVAEAEERKHALKGLDTPLEADSSAYMVQEIIMNSLEQWLREVNRLFKYYTSRENSNRIDSLLLCGGSSRIGGLLGYLKSNFNIPVRRLEQLSNCTLKKGTQSIPLDLYMNAVGGLIRK